MNFASALTYDCFRASVDISLDDFEPIIFLVDHDIEFGNVFKNMIMGNLSWNLDTFFINVVGKKIANLSANDVFFGRVFFGFVLQLVNFLRNFCAQFLTGIARL
ncbi:hypothetical protein D3C72_1691060 [compost metagenome]